MSAGPRQVTHVEGVVDPGLLDPLQVGPGGSGFFGANIGITHREVREGVRQLGHRRDVGVTVDVLVGRNELVLELGDAEAEALPSGSRPP